MTSQLDTSTRAFEHCNSLLNLCEEGIEESMCRRLFAELPPEVFIELRAQYIINLGSFSTTPDFTFPTEKIAIFCDSSKFHRLERDHKTDNCVSRELQRQNWLVLRFRTCEIRFDKPSREILKDFNHRAKHKPY